MTSSNYMDIASQLVNAAKKLSAICDSAIPTIEQKTIVCHATNPINYAWEHHLQYLNKWGSRGGKTILLGMNPWSLGNGPIRSAIRINQYGERILAD